MTKIQAYTAISRKVVWKSARNHTERYCGWLLIYCSSKKFERMAREAMDLCLRVLKESNKSRFDSYSVRNSVLIISHITFRDCRVHTFFWQPFSKQLYRYVCRVSHRKEAHKKAGGKIVNTTLNLSWYRYAQRNGFPVYMNRSIICFWHEPSWCLKTSMENGMIW